MSAKSLVLIFSIMLKRAYRYAVSFGSVGTVDIAGSTSSQYTEPVRHTHSRHVGRSATHTKVRVFSRIEQYLQQESSGKNRCGNSQQ